MICKICYNIQRLLSYSGCEFSAWAAHVCQGLHFCWRLRSISNSDDCLPWASEWHDHCVFCYFICSYELKNLQKNLIPKCRDTLICQLLGKGNEEQALANRSLGNSGPHTFGPSLLSLVGLASSPFPCAPTS